MKNFAFLLLLTFIFPSLYSQWECRSKLGAHLKPIGETGFGWATELIGSAGYLTNSYIYNGMGFLALDYSNSNHTFYIEGGAKYWRDEDLDFDIVVDKPRVGMREAFYRYQNEKHTLMLGLFSSSLKEYYLLNERILGLNYDYNRSNWAMRVSAGSVSKMYSRNGNFCTTCFIYDIIPDRPLNRGGNSIGDESFGAITLSYSFRSKKIAEPVSSTTDEDEFETFSDEFSTMEETKQGLISPKEIGLTFYTQYNNILEDLIFFTGPHVNIDLAGVEIKPEVLLQIDSIGMGLISYINLTRHIFWSNSHKTEVTATYYDFYGIDEGTYAANKYSNIFAGEVLRLDAPEFPLYIGSLKYQIPSAKAHLKVQYARSKIKKAMQETDIQLGKTFFNHLLVNAIFGYINSELLPDRNEAYLGRCEIRLSF